MFADTAPYKLLPYIQQNKPLLLLVALTLIRGLIYASVTPPWWQGHDEEFHFAQARLLIEQWSTGLSQDQNWPQEMVATFPAFPNGRWSQWSESYQVNLVNISDRYTNFNRFSPLSYYPYVLPGILLTHQDLLFQLFTLRFASILVTCGTIIFAFLSARQIFADSLLSQILVPWLVLFSPAFMITSSTISDANLAILLSTVVFYLLLSEISKERIGWRSLLALGLTVLSFYTKATTLFLLFVWLILLLVYTWKFSQNHWLWVGVVGVLFIVSLFFIPEKFQITLAAYLSQLKIITSEQLSYVLSWRYFWATFFFFWIILGWAVYFLAQFWYNVLFFLLLLAVVGLLLYVWRHLPKNKFALGIEQKGLLLSLLFAGVAIAGLVGLGILREGEGRSARYIFPTIVPLYILMTAGWRALLPNSWRGIGLVSLAMFFFLFDTMVWLNYAVPWYYPFWPR